MSAHMPRQYHHLQRAKFGLLLILSLFMIMQGSGQLSSASAATCGGEATVQKAGAALIKAAKTGTIDDFSKVLGSYSDMKSIAMFALGKHRKSLPTDRQDEFVGLTSSFVARTFSDYRLKFKAESLTVLDCRAGIIHTQLDALGVSRTYPVLWRMTGQKIVDMNIQNLWLSQLLRTNFDSVMSKSNGQIGALFTHLKK